MTDEPYYERLIRPLKAGDRFKTRDLLLVNATREMQQLSGQWVTVQSEMKTDYVRYLDDIDIDEYGEATLYVIEECDDAFGWFIYHINIGETNQELAKSCRAKIAKTIPYELPDI